MTFRTTGDTEVLLAAYEQWGEACLERLNGMFAFALWDGRSERLLVARDRFAEKPLFWARLEHGGIAFASEMKALLAHPQVSDDVDAGTLAEYVAGRYREDGEATLFRAIKRLPRRPRDDRRSERHRARLAVLDDALGRRGRADDA